MKDSQSRAVKLTREYFFIIILKLQLCVCVCVCVCESGRSPDAIRPRLKKVLFLCRATAGRYIREPTSTASKGASSRLKGVLLQSVVQKLDHEVGLRTATRRLPKSPSRESRLSMGGLRGEAILF